MIYRATLDDIDHINRCICRDFPGVDFTEILAEPLHIILMEGSSGAVFMWRGPGIYEVHVFFEVHGRAAMELSHRFLDVMRTEHGARFFWALVPVESRKVLIFTRWMGWQSKGVLETRGGPNELFILEDTICHQQ